MPTVNIPGGSTVVLVDRDQLRRRTPGPTLALPRIAGAMAPSVPTPPASFDWSRGGTLTFPTLGNDRWGDCFYAAVCHHAQACTGNAGAECSFDAAAVVARYRTLSGGDNGLDDATTMKEWKAGIVGPNGPRKILAEMLVDPADAEAVKLALWAYCGLIYTAALPDAWLNGARPGMTWDAATPNPRNGHAMYVSGEKNGVYDVQTWGFSPPVRLTRAGLLGSDPELIVAFSLDMFNPITGLSPAGQTYDQAASLWRTGGGGALPPSPFPPPKPDPPTPAPTPDPVPTPPPTPVPPAPVVVPGLTLEQSIAAMRRGIEKGRPYPMFNAITSAEKHAEAELRAAWPKGAK